MKRSLRRPRPDLLHDLYGILPRRTMRSYARIGCLAAGLISRTHDSSAKKDCTGCYLGNIYSHTS